MPRLILPSPRALIATPRRLVLPVGLRGFGSLWGDGVDDYVQGTNPISGSQPCTLVAWAKCRRRAGTFQTIMQVGNSANNQSHMLYVSSANTWGGGIYGVSNISSGIVVDDAWHRVAYVYPGSSASTFVAVDGVVRATYPPTSAAVAGSVARLFLRLGGSPYPFAGSIWDARVYSRAWTPREVAADFAGEWVDPTGLARWWTCENPGSGPTCREEIGGTNDPITGALWSPNVPMRQRRVIESARSVA